MREDVDFDVKDDEKDDFGAESRLSEEGDFNDERLIPGGGWRDVGEDGLSEGDELEKDDDARGIYGCDMRATAPGPVERVHQ